MTYLTPDLSAFQRENLRALAEYLDTGITELRFDMTYFQLNTHDRGFNMVPQGIHECGTVGCAAGHGPVIGIKPHRQENWSHYTSRVFTGGDHWAYEWCFSSIWTQIDNTPRGAAARIFLMLEKGVPGNLTHQMLGHIPLSYTVEPLPAINPAKVETPVPVPHE